MASPRTAPRSGDFFFREKHESRRTGKEKGRLIAGYSFIGKIILTAEWWISKQNNKTKNISQQICPIFRFGPQTFFRGQEKKWQWNWKIVTNKKIDGDWCRCRLSFIIYHQASSRLFSLEETMFSLCILSKPPKPFWLSHICCVWLSSRGMRRTSLNECPG